MSGHFESHFPESGSVDYADQSTNIDETTISELRLLAGRYPQPRSALRCRSEPGHPISRPPAHSTASRSG